MNKTELLGELKKLYDDGLIDQSEYDSLKQKILADPSVSAKTNVDSSQSQGFDLEKPKPISNKPNQTRAEEPANKSQNKKLIFGTVIILAVLTVFYFFTNSKSIAVSEAEADVAESKIDDALDNTAINVEKDSGSESEDRYVLPKEEDIYLDSRFDETFEDFKEKYLNKEINFADHFIIDEFGCGTCCSFIQMIDTRTGQVYSGPGTWGEGGASDAKFQKNSNEFTTYYYDCLEDNWVDSTIYTWDDNLKNFVEILGENFQDLNVKSEPDMRQDWEEPITITPSEIKSQINTNNNEIISFPDVEASYPGGKNAMKEFIRDNLTYPETSMQMGEQGKVYLSFVVEKDGEITNVKVEKGVSSDLDREAKRVVRLMPKWIPGENKGNVVRTKCSLPILFDLF